MPYFKKSIVILLLSFPLTAISLLYAAKDTILFFNPTVNNIETFAYLMNKEVLKLDSEEFHFLGIYHSENAYDYSKSELFLKQHTELPFSIHEIKTPLPLEMLYTKNECSAEFARLFKRSVGSIFLGGPDLPPATYNEPMHLLTVVSDQGRHFLELSYLYHLLGRNETDGIPPLLNEKPYYAVLGICLGMQTINVATGGSMIQDIPMEIYEQSSRQDVLSEADKAHRNYTYDSRNDKVVLTSYHFHEIRILKDFNTDKNKDQFPFVLSSHHQAIEKLGSGLYTRATSKDGKIIEAIGHKDFPSIIGLQFHPEKPGLYDPEQFANVSADSTIHYFSFLEEHNSYTFHIELWKGISKLFEWKQNE